MRHQLSLEIPEVANVRLLRVDDSSVYSDALPVDCARLEVSIPGFVMPAAIDVDAGFSSFFTSCDLGLQTVGCDDETHILPDGLYVVRYSVSPNDAVFVEYNHLRMSKALNRFYKKLCTLDLGGCEPDAAVKCALHEFQLIRSFLDAAKAKVEVCHEPSKGMELFVYAERMIERMCHVKMC
jgi:hypothetical protein